MQNRFERFTHALFEISRYWHKIAADEMEQYGLKASHAIYLSVMHRLPGGVTSVQLCELCGRDKADVSRAMADLEKKGLVTRAGGYRVPLTLTELGVKAAAYIHGRSALAAELAGSGISDDDRTVLYDMLERIAANMQRLSQSGLPEPELSDTIL